MLNEERIKLMTKMAAYEEKEGKKNISIGNYFRDDYLELQVMKSIVAATIAYFAILGMYVYYNFETLMQEVYKMDLLSFGKNLLYYYIGFVIIYGIISYVVSAVRYSRAKISLKRYFQNLKKLSALYENENKR